MALFLLLKVNFKGEKNMSIKEMKEKVQTNYYHPLMDTIDVIIKGISEKQDKNGNNYLVLSFSDGELTTSAHYFGYGKNDIDFAEGDICNIEIEAKLYQGAPNFNVYKVTKITPNNELLDKLCKSSPISYKTMMQDILLTVKAFDNEEYKKLVLEVLKENKDKLKYWAASKSIHHGYRTGLLYHMYRMMKAAEVLCTVYTEANKELVMSSCLLHDIGKIKEIETSETGVGIYTVEGEMFGHLYLGAEYIRNKCKELGISDITAMEISAIIASHHRKLEYGAIKAPQSLEAFLVSSIDDIDSRVDIYNESLKTVNIGEIGEKNFFLDGICYRNHGCESEEESVNE